MLEHLHRRSFLASFGLAASGLALGIVPRNAHGGAAEWQPSVFIHIAQTSLVTLVCHRSEMGQGIRSSLAHLLADELGANIDQVKLLQADGDPVYGDQNTDGSSSIRKRYTELRRLAAAVRVLLTQAAAKTLRVSAKSLTVADGIVSHPASGRSLPFGELIDAARKLHPIDPAKAELLPRSALRYIGAPALRSLDAPAYVTGAAIYGADVRPSGLWIAVIARPPVVGSTVRTYDDTKALAVPGVRAVVRMPDPQPPYAFKPWGGIAILADNTWAALRGRDALILEWSSSVHDTYDSTAFRSTLREAAQKPGTVRRTRGDLEAALAQADKVFEREYYVPHLPHVPMEPPTATAIYREGRVEIWASTQNPQAVQKAVAELLGIHAAAVTVHVTFLGGGFGRKSKADFATEAAYLAKHTGSPVRVQWTREDDIQHDYYNTVSYQHLTAGLDMDGRVTAWRHRTVFPPIRSVFDASANMPSPSDLQQGLLDLALDVEHIRVETGAAPAHVRIGWLRSVYNIFHAFATNVFIDELAAETGADPVATLLGVIGPPRILSLEDLGIGALGNYGASLEEHPVDAGRLRAVVERCAELCRWTRQRKRGRALGIAAHRSFLAYVAVVIALQQREGRIHIDEAWVVVDAGLIVNPDQARAQMEGALVFGLSHALFGGVTFREGRAEQSNFHDLRLLRIGDAPRRVHIELVESEAPPAGIGEPGVPPVAPALSNAYFAMTGVRLREFPMAKAFGFDR